MARKTVAITITADNRRLKADMRRASGEIRAFERQVGGTMNRIKRMRQNLMQSGIFGRGGGALRSAAGFAGMFGIHQMVMDAKNLDAALTDVAITGNLSASKLGQLKKMMFDVSNATGKSTTEVLSFVQAMTTATGDTGAAMNVLDQMGKVAVATGANMADLGQVFVKLTTTMKILPKHSKQALGVLYAQGKLGAMTVADLAQQMPEVVGASGILGKSATGMRGVSALGGLMQFAARGAGKAEAATSVKRFLQALYKQRGKIRKTFGVNIMDKEGNVRDLETVFGELAVAMGKKGGVGKAAKIFDVRGLKVATELAKAGQAGLGSKIGTLESFRTIFGAGLGPRSVIDIDFKRRQQSASQQINVEMNKIKNTFQRFAVDILPKIASTLKEWAPTVLKTVKFILEHSKSLLSLWLSWKGAQFFKNLMNAGAAGGAGAGGAIMTSAGMVMAGGRAGAGGRSGGRAFPFYTHTRRDWHQAPTTGHWVKAGRSGGEYYVAPGGVGMAGIGVSRVSAGGAWGAKPGVSRRLTRRQRLRLWYGRHSDRIGSGARGAGAAFGAADPFLGKTLGPREDMFAGQRMTENAALMSGNPYAMLIGGVLKGQSHVRGRYKSGWKKKVANAVGGAMPDIVNMFRKRKLSSAMDPLSNVFEQQRNVKEYKHNIKIWLNTTRAGEVFQKERGSVLEAITGGVDVSRGMGAARTLRNRLAGVKSKQREIVEGELLAEGKKPGQITEEMIKKRSPEYARQAKALENLNNLLLKWKTEGLTVKMHAVDPTRPGARTENANKGNAQSSTKVKSRATK